MTVAKIYLEWTTTFIIFPSVSRIYSWAKKQKQTKQNKKHLYYVGWYSASSSLSIHKYNRVSIQNQPPTNSHQKKKKTLLITCICYIYIYSQLCGSGKNLTINLIAL